MYINQYNAFPHGIMFHHFHDNDFYLDSEGSITADDLVKVIEYIGVENIINPNEFLKLLRSGENESKVCFTFDDGIRSQVDVAMPVLSEFNIKSFFFIPSSIFTNKPDLLEVYRYFRTNFFENINSFYGEFYRVLNVSTEKFFASKKDLIYAKKKKFPFYSIDDIKFRLIRDHLLKPNEYLKLMQVLFDEKKFDPHQYVKKLYMSKNDIVKIKECGHEIGLHSHSHPTKLNLMNKEEQKNEYSMNRQILSQIIKTSESKIVSMSHPCGSYNLNTLSVLDELNIDIGFRASMEKIKTNKINNSSNLEIAREDHSNIIDQIR